ncbi:ABC transporter substrate-binding protein [Marinomonas lutimaris]|uniref:ABC transporter substrate-binding protein n=1 Tax=Marinomonas lutimaris TaxID=2846746 RepID=UPI001C67F6D2|nr:ABC transporter substrate-binding protein [Marinomonas lutimaris]
MILKVIACLTLSLFLLGEKAYSSELRFGFTGPLTGPNAFMGNQIVRGIKLGFDRINDSKKLNYQLLLVPLDDGYEPSRTPSQVNTLINDYGVKAMLGSVGTPTNLASLSVLSKYDIPLISPLTGAQSIRAERSSPFIFNTRASYSEEAYYLIKVLVNDLGIKPNEIAVFAQKDSYGDAGLASTIAALTNAGLKDPTSILQIRHQRNSSEVSHSVADVLAVFPIPKAIIMISTYDTSANFIKQLESFGVSPLFATFSFTGLEALQTKINDTKAKVLITQTTPSLNNSNAPIIKQLKEDMARFGDLAPPTTMQLEGYINALIVGQALLPLKDMPASKEIEDSLKKLTRDNNDSQKQNELSVLNPKKRHIWVQFINHGELQELLFTDTQSPVIEQETE